MRMCISIYTPIPPWVNESYEPFGFYKFGVCCWQYAPPNGQGTWDVFDGPVEYINTKRFCTEPRYKYPRNFRIWLQPGVMGVAIPYMDSGNDLPDLFINGLAMNLASGKGLQIGSVLNTR